jgi:hypothetical protein
MPSSCKVDIEQDKDDNKIFLEDVQEESSAIVLSQEELIEEDTNVSLEQGNSFYFPFIIGNKINRIADDLPQCMIGYLTVLDGESMDCRHQNSKFAVKMQQEDFTVIMPGQWFTDLVIDFWMKWLTCNDDYHSCSMFVFSTHFYELLVQKGLERAYCWTKRKGVNVFNKNMILIPINVKGSLHWSLCAIINPSLVTADHFGETDKFPCMAFFDSLIGSGLHNHCTVATD